MEGIAPAHVHDDIISEIKSREIGGLVRLPDPKSPFHVGQSLRVVRGPFSGRLVLYSGMKPRDRVEVLLTMLAGRLRVTLPQTHVAAI
jgi:hypothetical protein